MTNYNPNAKNSKGSTPRNKHQIKAVNIDLIRVALMLRLKCDQAIARVGVPTPARDELLLRREMRTKPPHQGKAGCHIPLVVDGTNFQIRGVSHAGDLQSADQPSSRLALSLVTAPSSSATL